MICKLEENNQIKVKICKISIILNVVHDAIQNIAQKFVDFNKNEFV